MERKGAPPVVGMRKKKKKNKKYRLATTFFVFLKERDYIILGEAEILFLQDLQPGDDDK